MRFRNTKLQMNRSRKKDQIVESLPIHHKLEGFQHLTDSVDISFNYSFDDKSEPLSNNPYLNLFENRSFDSSQPHPKYQFPVVISIEDKLRRDYYKWSLNRDFLSFEQDNRAIKASPLRVETEPTRDWIVKLKAKKAQKMLYEQEARNLRADIQALEKVRSRFRIVDQIKQEKRKIMSQYFNS